MDELETIPACNTFGNSYPDAVLGKCYLHFVVKMSEDKQVPQSGINQTINTQNLLYEQKNEEKKKSR